MPQRFKTDLSHYSFSVGDIGKLQTLSVIPVLAGDSLGVNLEGVFRLAPLRRNLVVDALVELYAFYVPYRHIYGQTWIDFIKEGKAEDETFTAGPTAGSLGLSYLGPDYLGGEILPLWVSGSYNRIWNRYFRSPTDALTRADSYQASNIDEIRAGFPCGFLPTPWSTGTAAIVPVTERDVAAVTSFDIVDLNRVQAEYKTEVDRAYFGQRYNDIINVAFGSNVSTDVDERPTLCARDKFWLSGYDVDGTSDASLGTYSGKSAGIGRLSMRRKFFKEHGSLWIMCLARFPTIHTQERHPLMINTNPSYLQWAGDPGLVSAEPPAIITQADWFRAASGSDLGVGPYGQHYRYQPSNVHRDYQSLDGFSFIDTAIVNQATAHYIDVTEYQDVFQTEQLRQWQVAARIDVDARRVVPPARHSLYAGV